MLPSGITNEYLCAYVQCSFVEHRNYKVVYRRYASLFFLVGVDNDEVDPLACTSLDKLKFVASC